jgi:Tol biopolymer transport system component
MIGQTLAHYTVTGELGKGGMGEVFRATDGKLDREVAIKVLPQGFTEDAERLARFEREAKVLASLNHPNIAAIYGIEEQDGKTFLVLELAEGETLQERISRGSVSVEEAARIARQIAEAMEVAHDQGIIHRDLKPANVKVSAEGQVKVLDFGLAKAWESDIGSADMTHSPTLTAQMTGQGVIIGTASYMSPEQARGQQADKRSDIWSFGVVLYELFSGDQLFDGKTVSDVLAAVLRAEPNWKSLPGDTPAPLRNLLTRCLERDDRRRLRDIGEARIVLEDYLIDPEGTTQASGEVAPVMSPEGGLLRRWGVAGLLALVGLGAGWLISANTASDQQVVRASIPAPEGTSFDLDGSSPGPVVVSPDGRNLAFTAMDEDGEVLIHVRAVNAAAASALSGTKGAQYPFWSADSRSLGFFADGKLKRIQIAGGPPQSLCAAINGKGGTWSEDGVILFAPDYNVPIHRVPAVGGEAMPITTLDSERNDDSHRHPWFLPDGEHFLYLARASGAGEDGSAVVLASLEGGDLKILIHSDAMAQYASGHLLFKRESTLMAQLFDTKKLELRGEAFPLAEEIMFLPGAARGVFSSSENGVLAFQTGQAESETSLDWMQFPGANNAAAAGSAAGESSGTLGDLAAYRAVAISPDGQHAAVEVRDGEAGKFDLWIYEIARNLRTRFTFDPADDTTAVWSPDGAELLFSSDRSGQYQIYRKSLGGSGSVELLLDSGLEDYPTDWSPDGRSIFFDRANKESATDLMRLSLDDPMETAPVIQTQFREGGGRVSPDGRWLAYHSEESGEWETYVTSISGQGRKWQASLDGGVYPLWRSDGRALYYQSFDGYLNSVETSSSGDTFRVGSVSKLIQGPIPTADGYNYAVLPSGDRFLTIAGDESRPHELLNLVVGWPAELNR